MQLQKVTFYFALSLLILCSCHRDDINPNLPTMPDYDLPVVAVTASVNGEVVDKLGLPLEGVAVRIGSATTTTDEWGRYEFEAMTMNAKGTYVTASLPGYFPGSDMLYPLDFASGLAAFYRHR